MKKTDFDRRMRYVKWFEATLPIKLRNYQKILIFAMIDERKLQKWEAVEKAFAEQKAYQSAV